MVSVSELVSALSFALDLVEDARPGHAVRSCLLGLRIAQRMGLDETQQADLYYALLLKDAGCSSNARLICDWVGGDDRTIKREAKLVDWTKRSFASVRMLWRNAPIGSGWGERIFRLKKMATHPGGFTQHLVRTRCERGADIMEKIGMTPAAAEAVRSLDEHWDGGGQPVGARGKSVPLLSRIMLVAQHLDIFGSEAGRHAAIVVLKERSGRWFDPAIVKLVVQMDREADSEAEGGLPWLWQDLWSGREREIVLRSEPGMAVQADDDRIDRIAEAFADVVDAKSSFTYHHSLGVTRVTMGIAEQMGLDLGRRKILYRAALLHDLGKLRVPNTILDKRGPLAPEEWTIIREHPGLTRNILERIDAFAEVARIAGSHHESLDGRGYPQGLRGDEISLEVRILTMADVYSALTEERPYRGRRSDDQAIAILHTMVPHQLDSHCFDGLLRFLGYDASQHQSAPAAIAANQT
jgi:putative nucleotidyltransferase with HDIG domain